MIGLGPKGTGLAARKGPELIDFPGGELGSYQDTTITTLHAELF